MDEAHKFSVGDQVSVISWDPQYTPPSPSEDENLEDDDDVLVTKEITIKLDMSDEGMDLWRNPITRDSVGEFSAEIIAIDENGYCTVRTSHAFRSAMCHYLFKRYERAGGRLPCPKTEDYSQHYLLSPFQLVLLDPWTTKSRCEFLYGYQPHLIGALITPFSSQSHCMHDNHGNNRVNAVKRIMINHYGSVCEVDACKEHAKYDGWCMEAWPWNSAKQKKTA